ncbi:mitochondrial CIV assembly protein Cox23 [Andalucia godoyi]|uniref:Mitochondrial CIV assembly protein Cox23 n=1 Tax=Andalucia godoyi TaxID=505711 RepID=A0A8K0F305_ANDGO|nr:mitochondrial CIV assembly protein Cox23 [Andalucia godoyi]|eukprot:ANDGO_08770.mRNA.1 mitochondrial CIV assembly protein Cox23
MTSLTKIDNPCQKYALVSYKCQEENQADKSVCKDHFDIYKECMRQYREHLKALKKSSSSS